MAGKTLVGMELSVLSAISGLSSTIQELMESIDIVDYRDDYTTIRQHSSQNADCEYVDAQDGFTPDDKLSKLGESDGSRLDQIIESNGELDLDVIPSVLIQALERTEKLSKVFSRLAQTPAIMGSRQSPHMDYIRDRLCELASEIRGAFADFEEYAVWVYDYRYEESQ